MSKIKALTLYQPWASLIAVGAKRIETRSWPTKYLGPLAIHAAKARGILSIEALPVAGRILFAPETGVYGWKAQGKHCHFGTLPRGAVIAVCQLMDCLQISHQYHDGHIGAKSHLWAELEDGQEVEGQEYLFGDYRAGRYAWILEDVKRLETPIPAKGRQGLWDWDAVQVESKEG